jgi:hypothetical protein
MTKSQVEVITSVQRRRRWSRAEKERIRSDRAGRRCIRGGSRSRRSCKPVVPMAAAVVRCCIGCVGILAGGGGAGSGSVAGDRDRVCDRGADAAGLAANNLSGYRRAPLGSDDMIATRTAYLTVRLCAGAQKAPRRAKQPMDAAHPSPLSSHGLGLGATLEHPAVSQSSKGAPSPTWQDVCR